MVVEIIEKIKDLIVYAGDNYLSPDYFLFICRLIIEQVSLSGVPLPLVPAATIFIAPFCFIFAYWPLALGFIGAIFVPIIEKFG